MAVHLHVSSLRHKEKAWLVSILEYDGMARYKRCYLKFAATVKCVTQKGFLNDAGHNVLGYSVACMSIAGNECWNISVLVLKEPPSFST